MLERMSNSGSDESDESDVDYTPTDNNPTPGADHHYESHDRVYYNGKTSNYGEGTFLNYTSGALAKVLFDESGLRSVQVRNLRPINGGQNQTTTLNTATVASTPQAENGIERKNGDDSDDLSNEDVQNEEGGQKRGHDTSVSTKDEAKRMEYSNAAAETQRAAAETQHAAAEAQSVAAEAQRAAAEAQSFAAEAQRAAAEAQLKHLEHLEKENASLKGKITNLENENANLLARCETNMERLKEIDTLTAELDEQILKTNDVAVERDSITVERDSLTVERDSITVERDNLAAKCDSLEAALAAARDNFNAALAASFNGI